MARASFYRWRNPVQGAALPRISSRALSGDERACVLGVLHEDRFVDLAPAEVFATLLDEGRYLCSERTMYRVLASNAEVRERRNQLRHPAYAAPELLAVRPNELWSWDITKLHGPAKWTYYYLYVILDVFSRYVVGWMVALCESAALAQLLFRETCARQQIVPAQLTVHADPRVVHALEGGCTPALGSWRREDALAPARIERQSILGVALQDVEVPA